MNEIIEQKKKSLGAIMKQYLNLMKKVLEEGTTKEDRTGTGTYSLFGHQMRFDLSKGFPLTSLTPSLK